MLNTCRQGRVNTRRKSRFPPFITIYKKANNLLSYQNPGLCNLALGLVGSEPVGTISPLSCSSLAK